MNDIIVAEHTALIPVQVNSDGVQTVNARDLHAFLESGQEFRHWIKSRIEQYGLVEGQDFTTSENFIRGGKATDYHCTLDMAKELAMVERNAKGKQARQYFIECEKVARQRNQKVADPRTAALIESLVRFDQLEQQQKVLQAQTAALTDRLDQIETAQTHFTVVGYMNTVAHKSIPLTEASSIGRKATKLCKERDLDIGSVPDPRFGRANTYPKHILDEVLGDLVAALT